MPSKAQIKRYKKVANNRKFHEKLGLKNLGLNEGKAVPVASLPKSHIDWIKAGIQSGRLQILGGKEPMDQKVLEEDIFKLNNPPFRLSHKVCDLLSRSGISKVSDLVSKLTSSDSKIKGIGPAYLIKVKDALSRAGVIIL